MDLEVRLYAERAENEMRLANAIFILSENKNIKSMLKANENDTFYSAVISHAYYSIPPDVHKRTYEEFKKNFVDTGILDVELLKIYKTMIVRADELLFLLERERKKRGQFTYHTIAQANIPYAEESIRNARKFVENIVEVMKTKER